MSFLKTMFNSVARTFGRILAYALIGIAIYFIASKVHAAPQYRMSNLSGEWGEWNNISPGDTYSSSTNITTSWGSYIQLKDTTTMESNKSYNLNASFQVKIIGQGDRELFSSIVPYIYNGSTLSETDKCTISGTKSDSTSSGLLPSTTHIYNANINCVGLKNTGYYPYITIRFKANQNTLLTSMQINASSWNFTIGSDSTDANNIMNNQNQNTQSIINGLNDMGDSITNSVNQSTTQVIEALENQNKVCNENIVYRFTKNDAEISGRYLDSNGNLGYDANSYVSTYYRADGKYTTIVNQNGTLNGASICFYDKNKTLLSCEAYQRRQEFTVVNPTDSFYLRVSTYDNIVITITTSYCYDYREKETEQNEEIVDNLHNMLTLLQSDDAPSGSNISTAFGGVNLTDETPFTNLLMFPVLIFSYFSNSMSNSCSTVVLGTLYGHQLTLPCLNLPNYLGLTLWNIIDLLFVFYMIYNIAHLFIGILEDITELRSPFLRFFIKNKGVVNHD